MGRRPALAAIIAITVFVVITAMHTATTVFVSAQHGPNTTRNLSLVGLFNLTIRCR